MREVARRAEVSAASVSRALRRPATVSEDTLRRVNGAVAELGYIYNAAAADVSAGRSTVIGVLVPSVSNGLFGETLHGIQDVAMTAGFSLMQGITHYNEAIESRLLDSLLQRRVRGLILTGLTLPQEERVEKLARETGLRVVVVWEKPRPGSVGYVGIDNRAAAAKAVNHLISLGHRRIGIIVGPYALTRRTRHRLEGYRDAMEAAGIAFDAELVIERNPEPVEGREAMERLLELHQPPTAVFAASDLLAIGALRAVHAAGLTIPNDMSIVGFDDIDLAAYQEPPLTTVRIDGYEIGRLAAQVLIGPGDQSPRHYCLDTDLVIRSSTGPVRGARR